jgi:hypothetical protein
MTPRSVREWSRVSVVFLGMAIAGCGGTPLREDATGAATPATQNAKAPNRAAAVERLRAELARLLKKDVSQVPTETPVAELGADDLTVVEWQMASELAFRVDIDNDRLFDPATKSTRKDLTVTSMAEVVAASRPWPADRKH